MIIHNCEQGSEIWRNLRIGRPTTSEFGSIITGTGKPSRGITRYAVVLAYEKYTGKPLDRFSGNKYTDRGKKFEPEACANYEMLNQVDIEHVGFITDDMMKWGTSTDGLVNDDGLAEFKCQIAENHLNTLMYFDEHGTIPKSYVPQLQGEMMIAERKWADICFYHPDLPTLTVRHFPDLAYVRTLKKQLKAVITKRNLILKTIKSMKGK